MTHTIGFIGFGEVGHAFARGFIASGHPVQVLAIDAAPPGSDGARLAQKRAEDAGAELRQDIAEVIGSSDLVFSAVPSFAAVDAAESASAVLRPGQGFYDLTASHPETKRLIREVVRGGRDIPFADLAIVGPVRVRGHEVPILASGSFGTGHLELLRGLGMDVEVVSEQPGDASAIKLCRSVFTKGLEALLVESMLAAQRLGVAETVLRSVARTMESQPFAEAANRYITGNAVHAERRVHEVEDVIRLLESAGVDPLVTAGTLARMRQAVRSGARERFKGEPPDDYADVIDFYSAGEARGA